MKAVFEFNLVIDISKADDTFFSLLKTDEEKKVMLNLFKDRMKNDLEKSIGNDNATIEIVNAYFEEETK